MLRHMRGRASIDLHAAGPGRTVGRAPPPSLSSSRGLCASSAHGRRREDQSPKKSVCTTTRVWASASWPARSRMDCTPACCALAARGAALLLAAIGCKPITAPRLAGVCALGCRFVQASPSPCSLLNPSVYRIWLGALFTPMQMRWAVHARSAMHPAASLCYVCGVMDATSHGVWCVAFQSCTLYAPPPFSILVHHHHRVSIATAE